MEVIITDHWNEYLQYFSSEQKDIYYTEEYAKLYSEKDAIIVSAVCIDDCNYLLMPFLKRKVGETSFDFETAYGYGGPITNTNDSSWNRAAIKEMIIFLHKEYFICGFIRFNPLLNNADLCRDLFSVIDDRKTVVIDTSMSCDDIWTRQLSSKNRNMIRKAEKNGLKFSADYEFAHLNDFISLYNSTMERLEADDFYYFDESYYKQYVRNLKNKSFLGVITLNNKLVAAAMFMYDGYHGHYHLAGSNHEGARLGANNLMLWSAACEMNKLGVRQFHLGGGINSDPENSLLKFKNSFSKTLIQFSIGKLVINENAYKKICTEWEEKHPQLKEKYGNRLLMYRYNS